MKNDDIVGYCLTLHYLLVISSNLTDTTNRFGTLLADARKRKRLTLRAVQDAIGISNAYLSQLETGKVQSPSPIVLHKLSELYGIPYATVMQEARVSSAGDCQRNQFGHAPRRTCRRDDARRRRRARRLHKVPAVQKPAEGPLMVLVRFDREDVRPLSKAVVPSKQHFANARSKDETRRKTYLLGNCKASAAGAAVSSIRFSVSRLSPLSNGARMSRKQERLHRPWRDLTGSLPLRANIAFMSQAYKPSACGDEFAALYAVEYGDGIRESEIDQAREDVRRRSRLFLDGKAGSPSPGRATTRDAAPPDLRAYGYESRRHAGCHRFPLESGARAIVDWKVHTFRLAGRVAAIDDLRSGANARGTPRRLSRCPEPLPSSGDRAARSPALHQTLRKHAVSDEDVKHADGYIARSAESMLLAVGAIADKASELTPSVKFRRATTKH